MCHGLLIYRDTHQKDSHWMDARISYNVLRLADIGMCHVYIYIYVYMYMYIICIYIYNM